MTLRAPDNSRNGILESQQTCYKITEDFVSESIHNLIDMQLPGSEKSNISACLNETSTSSGKPKTKSIKHSEKHSPKKLERINLCPPQY